MEQYLYNNKHMASKNEWKFWVSGVVMIGLLSAVVIYALQFLGVSLNHALNAGLINAPPAVKFNLDKLEGLGINIKR